MIDIDVGAVFVVLEGGFYGILHCGGVLVAKSGW